MFTIHVVNLQQMFDDMVVMEPVKPSDKPLPGASNLACQKNTIFVHF